MWKAVAVIILSLGMFGTLFPYSANFVSADTSFVELFPYHDQSGFSYQIISSQATPPTGFQNPGFNDSAWPVSSGAFGSTGQCPVQKSSYTYWQPGTQLVLRKNVEIPANVTNIVIHLAVDNDILGLYVNGTLLAGPLQHTLCPNFDDFSFPVPQSLIHTGTNTIAFNVLDQGVESFFDARMSGEIVPPPAHTPVLIVPGVLGTDIKDGNELLWANTKMSIPGNSDDFMDPLQYKADLTPLAPNLLLSGVIRSKPFLDYTQGLINQLTSPDIGYVEGQDLFTFPYDWRDGVSSANIESLKGQINYILTQTPVGQAVGKVNVVAHSTGGLLVKKYVMDTPNHNIDKAIFVGVPNLGAPKATKVLTYGDSFDIFGLNPEEMKKISKNMPVVYDLSPSQLYYNSLGSWVRIFDNTSFPQTQYNLSYEQVRNHLLSDHGTNALATSKAESLHTANFDTFDVSSRGVESYRIVGCKNETIGGIQEFKNTGSTPYEYKSPIMVNGDKTVPFGSSIALPVSPERSFYALKHEHSTLMSDNNTRQLIVNLLTGSSLPVGSSVISQEFLNNNPNSCKVTGWLGKIFSPLDILVTDQFGNTLGKAPDGTPFTNIPGASFDIVGEHKFFFLPTDERQVYFTNIKGTGQGRFTLLIDKVQDDITVARSTYLDQPVTSSLAGNIVLNGNTSLNLDTNGDGSVDKTLAPDAVLDSLSVADIVPPVTSVKFLGTQGQTGFYRSSVGVVLNVKDFSQAGISASGVLKTMYKLDEGVVLPYTGSVPVTGEGKHTVTFFSTDKAGNTENSQTASFTIDLSPPEVSMQWSPGSKDLVFTATDNQTGLPTVTDSGNKVTVTDTAGNTTTLTFAQTSRRTALRAGLTSITYNGKTLAKLPTNALLFSWAFGVNNVLTSLSQYVRSTGNYNILASYDGKVTAMLGLDSSGKIAKKFPGLALLKVTTNKGILDWGY